MLPRGNAPNRPIRRPFARLGTMRPSPLIFLLAFPAMAQNGYAPRLDLEEGHFLKAMADAEAQLKVNPASALAWAAKAHALTSFLRFPEALEAANRALALNPNLADAYLSRGLARGGHAIQQRNFSSLRKATGALDDLRRATELDPSLATAWMSLGLAYQQMPGILGGSTRKALKCADGLRRVHPARGDLLKGMILSMEGRWWEAEPFFARAIQTAPGDAQIVAGYMESLGSRKTREALGSHAQNSRLFAEAVRLLPGVSRKAIGVAAVSDAMLDAGREIQAWETAEGHLSQVDAPSLLRLQLGKIAAKSGLHRSEGLIHLDRTISEPLEGGSGGTVSAQWRKGQILSSLGRIDEARAAVRAAMASDPQHRGVNQLWAELSK